MTQGWEGVAAPDVKVRYVTVPGGTGTALAVIRTQGGRVERFTSIPGSWGIPSVTINGTGGGLSSDGRTLILGDASLQSQPLRRDSAFLVIDTKMLQTRTVVESRHDAAAHPLDGQVPISRRRQPAGRTPGKSSL